MKKILICCFSIAMLASCKKEVTELPAATQTGANTFGAKINGVFWAPQGFGPLPANDILEARMAGHDITINARNFSSSPNETEFQLTIRPIQTTNSSSPARRRVAVHWSRCRSTAASSARH